VARGIGGFVLFLVAYTLAGSVAATLIVYGFAYLIRLAPPSEGSTLDMSIQLAAAVLSGYLGVILGALVLGAVMKDYPARGIGVAFVTWLVANYLLHFVFFGHSHYIPDFEVYSGLLQSSVAVATAWFTFRLPPLTAPKSLKLEKGQPQVDAVLPSRRPDESTDEYLHRINVSGALDEHIAETLIDERQKRRGIKVLPLLSFSIPFVAAFWFGFIGHHITTPIWIAGVMTVWNIWDGWRQGGIIKSVILGVIYASSVVIPIYFVGHWLGQ
jgi:hypothetical protein